MKYAKAILAAVFGLSPAVVVGILALFRVHVDQDTVTWLLGVLSPVLGTLGVAVGPKNKDPETPDQTQEQAIQELSAQWAQHLNSSDPATLETPIKPLS